MNEVIAAHVSPSIRASVLAFDGPVVIMAGGTGGHIYPGIAVANAIKARFPMRSTPVMWLGSEGGLETELVPKAGLPIQTISVSGLRGKGMLTRLAAPFKLLKACWQARRFFKEYQPSIVIGMGGFVAGPGGLMSKWLGIPLIVHEQNAVAGMTNRYLNRLATVSLTAFPDALPNGKTVGNPVRKSLTELDLPAERFLQRSGRLKLLVLGGSLGAQAINECLPQALALMPEADRPVVIHQTGHKTFEETRTAYEQAGIKAEVVDYIHEMDQAYAWADLAVCRAGAMTIAELTAVGLGSVLIPFPHAVDDHQTLNADYLVKQGGALLKQQAELTPEWLAEHLALFDNNRTALVDMSSKAKLAAYPNALSDIVTTCYQVAMQAGHVRREGL